MADSATWPRSVASHVALDFANTDVFAQGDRSVDILRDVSEFRSWCAAQGLGGTSAGDVDPPDVLRHAGEVRAAVRAIAESFARGAAPDERELLHLRDAYAQALSDATPTTVASGLDWQWPDDSPRSQLDQLTHAAVTLFTTGRVDRIRACPSCGFLFYDTTKNGSRKWCSMDDCGAEDKARRYVETRAARREQGRGA